MSNSFARGLQILNFFSEDRTRVGIDEIVKGLGISLTTAYRYLGHLSQEGLLAHTGNGTYVLGHKIIELDRLIRMSDPLLSIGQRIMAEYSARYGLNMLLASYYQNSIMCVDIAWPDQSVPIKFERGKPMSMFRGAMAKIILANLSQYQLKKLMLDHAASIRDANLGETWREFRQNMSGFVRNGYAETRAEMIPETGGVSAAIFDKEQKVIGSITFVIPVAKWQDVDMPALRQTIVQVGKEITAELGAAGDSDA